MDIIAVMDTQALAAQPLREVVALFLRLGFTAFGGPAAHIAIMHNQVVRQRAWRCCCAGGSIPPG
jgi:chromate transport protein ChrA